MALDPDDKRVQAAQLAVLLEMNQAMKASPMTTAAAQNKAQQITAPSGDKSGGPSLSILFRPFAALVAPLAMLATYTQSTASGFGVLGGAIKVFASALAPIILPAVFLLATALIALSDVIWTQLKPSLGEFYQFIVSTAIPAIKWFVEAISDAIGIVKDFANALPKLPTGQDIDDLLNGVTRKVEETTAKDVGRGRADPLNTGAGDYDHGGHSGGDFPAMEAPAASLAFFSGLAHSMSVDAGRRSSRARNEAEEKGDTAEAKGDGGGVSGIVKNAMSDVLKELKLSVSPKAQSFGLVAAGRQAQIAALNQSPFEAKMLDRMTTVIQALESVVNNTKDGGLGP